MEAVVRAGSGRTFEAETGDGFGRHRRDAP